MANSGVVYARIDPELKKDVDEILHKLQVSPSSLIQMLYGQVKLTNGIPFDIKLPDRKPVFLDELSLDELNTELAKGLRDIEEDKVYSEDKVNSILKKEFGI
jgi:addiction module RelB/DinJ family antitoxin